MQSSTARKLAQIPSGCLIVGIDPHKRMHAGVIMSQQAQILSKVKIGNTRQDFDYLVERAQAECPKAGATGVIFAIEAGGHYWRNLAYYLEERGLPLRLISPLTLKRQREGEDLDRRKNDHRDATMAAELLRIGKFTETRLLQGNYAELRALHQCYQRLRKQHSRNSNLLRALLDGLFPEFCQVFKDPSGKTAMAVLVTEPIPAVIAAWTECEFIAVVRSAQTGRRLGINRDPVGVEDVAGCEGVAVVPGDTLSQVEGDLEAVARDLPRFGEVADDVHVLVELDETVVDEPRDLVGRVVGGKDRDQVAGIADGALYHDVAVGRAGVGRSRLCRRRGRLLR